MTDGKADILIVEDEQSIRDALRFSLEREYNLITASNGRTALELATKRSIDLALLDIKVPEINGLELLERIKDMDSSIPVIMITAVKTVDSAVRAMKLGAYDYIVKPFDINELKILIEKALEKRMLVKQNTFLKEELEKAGGFEKIIGNSSSIKELFRMISNVAKSDSTILISGESGTGKELAARAIHNHSNRTNKLFVAVNCAAIPENLLESELFGYEKGAFTGAFERHLGKFEIANGGTIFLDEIGLLPLPMQAKMLRVLQEKMIDRVGGSSSLDIDVRVIAATNSDLKKEVAERKFRSDLYYRLNVIPIHIPPLRERTGDIELLAKYFIGKFNKEFGKKIKGLSDDVLKALLSYNWPGNVRELENLFERLVVLADKDVVSKEQLPPEISKGGKAFDIEAHTKKFEVNFIKDALESSNLNDRQMKALEFIKNEGKITKQKYIRITNAPKTTAFRDLASLVKLHILSQKGIGKSSYYTFLE